MEPLTVTIEDARKALGIGRSTIYELINEGKLKRIKIGARALITTTSIRQLVADAERWSRDRSTAETD